MKKLLWLLLAVILFSCGSQTLEKDYIPDDIQLLIKVDFNTLFESSLLTDLNSSDVTEETDQELIDTRSPAEILEDSFLINLETIAGLRPDSLDYGYIFTRESNFENISKNNFGFVVYYPEIAADAFDDIILNLDEGSRYEKKTEANLNWYYDEINDTYLFIENDNLAMAYSNEMFEAMKKVKKGGNSFTDGGNSYEMFSQYENNAYSLYSKIDSFLVNLYSFNEVNPPGEISVYLGISFNSFSLEGTVVFPDKETAGLFTNYISEMKTMSDDDLSKLDKKTFTDSALFISGLDVENVNESTIQFKLILEGEESGEVLSSMLSGLLQF